MCEDEGQKKQSPKLRTRNNIPDRMQYPPNIQFFAMIHAAAIPE